MKVDFYVLETQSSLPAWRYACTLIETAHHNAQPVYVHTASKEDAERIDTLLWTYRDDSFIPHALLDAQHENPAPIQIGYGETTPEQTTLLINLSRDIPTFYQQFNHIIEIVFSDPVVQQLARDRFRQYREAGCELNTHKIKN